MRSWHTNYLYNLYLYKLCLSNFSYLLTYYRLVTSTHTDLEFVCQLKSSLDFSYLTPVYRLPPHARLTAVSKSVTELDSTKLLPQYINRRLSVLCYLLLLSNVLCNNAGSPKVNYYVQLQQQKCYRLDVLPIAQPSLLFFSLYIITYIFASLTFLIFSIV